MRTTWILLTVVLLLFLSVVPVVGCQQQPEQSQAARPPAPTQDFPQTRVPLDLPDEGNPKLDSQLNQLVHAERGGGLPTALEDLLQAGCVDILQMPGIRLEDLDKRQIFIHFAQEPTQSQMGIA